MKAVNIYPSSPISLAKGSKKFAIYVRRVLLAKLILAKSHITAPAGAATDKALPKTKSVLSNMERTITLVICGFL